MCVAGSRLVRGIADIEVADAARYGGKAAGLARMAAAGIPVPPAFVIGTGAFHAYRDAGGRLPASLRQEIGEALARLGEQAGRGFGDPARPLLVSVRSGARISMPGMMDTVLNLGLGPRSAAGLAAQTRSAPFVVDTWLRFWRMYGEIVLGADTDALAEDVAEAGEVAAAAGTEAAFGALEAAIVAALAAQGIDAQTDIQVQLDRAICAVFESWDSPRAKAYREHHRIPDDLGTAVTVQAMVYGNADANSGSGVAFTRNPNTGERAIYGEYLPGRQGEDLVSGARTPIDLSKAGPAHAGLHEALEAHGRVLERLYRDAVDIEFTVEAGRLFLLQVRPAKRTALAAVRIAADLAEEGLLPRAGAISLVSTEQVRRLLRPVFDPDARQAATVAALRIGSSPGHAAGAAVLDADRAAELAAQGTRVILVRPTTSPLDIRGMLAADGIVTAKGGALSHAAVVSRALDKPCVVGCEAISIDAAQRSFSVAGRRFTEGDAISIDGGTGEIFDGRLPLHSPARDADRLARLLAWADDLAGARFWLPARDISDVAAFPPESHGLAVVCMTDAVIARGEVGALAAAIGTIGHGRGQDTAEQLKTIARQSTEGIIGAAGKRPVHIRLPRLTSERARATVPGWAELEPRLYLPLGNLQYVRPLLAGIAEAVSSCGKRDVTVLLSGLTDPAEFRRFRGECEDAGSISAGVAVQNVAALGIAPTLLREGAVLWLDIDEIIRSSHGFLSELLFAGATFDDYVAQGFMEDNPRTVPKPFLRDLLRAAAEALGDARPHALAGVDSGTAGDAGLLTSLFDLGFRDFAVPASQMEIIRLLLGRHVAAGGQ